MEKRNLTLYVYLSYIQVKLLSYYLYRKFLEKLKYFYHQSIVLDKIHLSGVVTFIMEEEEGTYLQHSGLLQMKTSPALLQIAQCV
jgi:hypothetical protein